MTIQTGKQLVEWIDGCVLGDLRTLRSGIDGRASNQCPSRPSGGGNFLLASGCWMALEYFSRIYEPNGDAVSKVKKYVDQFLVAVNPRYGQVVDLLIRAFRNGMIHRSWPKAISIQGDSRGPVNTGIGIDPDDEHLEPARDRGDDTFVINARRLFDDLERSFDGGFKKWILNEATSDAFDRASAEQLQISSRDTTCANQLNCIRTWNTNRPKPA